MKVHSKTFLPPLIVVVAALTFTGCGDEPEIEEVAPETSAAPIPVPPPVDRPLGVRPPNRTGAGGGTRSDYQPSTGPGGTTNTDEENDAETIPIPNE